MRKISGGMVAAINQFETTKITSATNPGKTHRNYSNGQSPPKILLINPVIETLTFNIKKKGLTFMKPLLLLLLLSSSPSFSLTVSPETIQTQLNEASFVAQVETLGVEIISDEKYFARSLATLRVEKILSIKDDGGWFAKEGETLQVSSLGGETGNRGVIYPGLARPRKGVRYQIYLKRRKDQQFEITGFEEGLKTLQPLRNYSRNRTDGSNGDGSGAFLYWDETFFPIPYFISEPTFRNHPEYITGIDLSFKTWRNVSGTKIEFISMGCSKATYNENDGINTVFLINQNWEFDTTAIAITRNFYIAGSSERAGLVLDSDILLNAVNHSFTMTGETGKHDIQNIVTHEVGHFLGLGHEIIPKDENATMYAVASTGETKKRILHSSEISAITLAYAGTGQKFSQQNSVCQVTNPSTGCRLGVNHNSNFPYGLLFGILFLLLHIPLSRRLTK